MDARSLSGKSPDAPDKDVRSFIYKSLYSFLVVSSSFLEIQSLKYKSTQNLFAIIPESVIKVAKTAEYLVNCMDGRGVNSLLDVFECILTSHFNLT